mmetsp:Transcript_10071/g.11444  ORF Transcript_10071/g.11444 Transcript_10071/m.11444 type:complete len:416 (+) Transcript_10071:37-1284(+)
MESPIDQRIWKYLFHGTAAFFTAGIALSLWNERRKSLSSLNEPFSRLSKCKSGDEQAAILQDIQSALMEDAQKKKGAARMSVQQNAAALMRCLKLASDGSNSAAVELAIRIVVRVFGSDVSGRVRLHKAGGYRLLMSVLSESHRQGNRRVMEAAATALLAATEVDDSELVLAHDVPAGAEGACSLTKFPSTVKMLRILDPNAPIVFLNALTGIFANLTALRSGAVAIGAGTDGVSGMEYFLRLLGHGNQGIVEHAARTIRFLARAGVGQRELCTEEAVASLGSVFDVNRDPKITNAILTIVLIMIDGDNRKEFLHLVEHKSDILPTLFQVWCRGTEKTVRDRAEFLVHLLDRTDCTVTIRRLMEGNRNQILERKSKDEEAKRKQMQQMKQQQMMQQMMMMQEMGGGMDPSMMGME